MFFMQIILVVATVIGTFLIIIYFLYAHQSCGEIITTRATADDDTRWEMRNRLYTLFVVSFSFSLYSFLMGALGFLEPIT